MKYLITISFLLLSVTVWAQTGCFQAIQNGQPVKTICANQPVTFQDCTPNPDPQSVIFYYPGPKEFDPQNFNQNDLIEDDEQFTFAEPGIYIVTQIINREGGDGTKVFARTYEVKGSPAPSFSFQSCANGTVSFTITDSNYDNYTFDFGDGEKLTTTAGKTIRHTYTSPRAYSVSVAGSYKSAGSCGNTTTKNVTALPKLNTNSPTQINVLKVLQQGVSGSLQLELTGLVPGYSYVIERSVNSTAPYEEIGRTGPVNGSTLTYTVNNVNTTDAALYRARPIDACEVVFINSNRISTISLMLSAGEEQVSLNWENLPEFEQYVLYRNGNPLQTLPKSARSYTDNSVTCGQTYSYYLIGTGTDSEGDKFSSVSATQQIAVTSTKVPTQPYLLTSFNLDNQVELVITADAPSGTVLIERSTNGAAFTELSQVQQLRYVDSDIKSQPVCYRATFTNACGNTSPISNVSCPIILEAEQQVDGSVQLNWSAYTGFPNGVEQYTVELLDGSGNVVNSYSATGLTLTDNNLSNQQQLLRYRVRATPQRGSSITYSNVVEVEQDALLYIPSAFTPNGDGLNDVFEVKGKFFSSYVLRIYNRLGNVIYEGTQADPAWDGTENGQKALIGAYGYEIVVTTSFGTTKAKRGTITLLR